MALRFFFCVVSTNLSRLTYAGEIQNWITEAGNGNVFFITSG